MKRSSAVAKCSAAQTTSDISGTYNDRPSLCVERTQSLDHTTDTDGRGEPENRQRVGMAAVEIFVSYLYGKGVTCRGSLKYSLSTHGQQGSLGDSFLLYCYIHYACCKDFHIFCN